jgi:hypothetical protein
MVQKEQNKENTNPEPQQSSKTSSKRKKKDSTEGTTPEVNESNKVCFIYYNCYLSLLTYSFNYFD